MTAGAHWALAYIGEPWVAHSNDCWAFCRRVWAERFGLAVPIIEVDASRLATVAHAFRDNEERGRWQQVADPREGDAVLMAHCRHPSHIGIWIEADGGGVLHCIKGPGVVFMTPVAAARAGWSRMEFYRRGAAA